MAPIVPPIKCQGIKTKIVGAIRSLQPKDVAGRWVEPFCGSCVVAFNLRPEKALLCDSNEHIIRFFTDLQSGKITSGVVREFLLEQGARLNREGEDIYYETRDKFNREPTSLAFLFLNRACFNGVMRFNRKGKFNVPFCRKPGRFARAYVTKITNQVAVCGGFFSPWSGLFKRADFRQTLALATASDVVYADPPYAGRHVDYYNSWSEKDERDLAATLKGLPCRFVLSTWYKNKYRTNPTVAGQWSDAGFAINLMEHFYHVGPTERLRNSMTEALISNYAGVVEGKKRKVAQPGLFDALDNGALNASEIATPAEPGAAPDRDDL